MKEIGPVQINALPFAWRYASMDFISVGATAIPATVPADLPHDVPSGE